MTPLLDHLADRLDQLQAASLRRTLRPLPRAGKAVTLGGRSLLNLASNDYLALAQHPRLIAAAHRAIDELGVGATASRLVAGHLELHARAEAHFAAFKHAEAALMFPTGYAANLGLLTALAGPGDLVCLDRLNHASLIDAARASGARVRTYPHRNTAKLARLLARHAQAVPPPGADRPTRRFVVTDSVFSMDGDTADLPALCDTAEAHDAAVLVDEAHGTGVLGDSGAGLCEAQGVSHRVTAVMSTASKALGGLGGVVTGPRVLIETLVNLARPLIYSTAVPPAQAAVLAEAVAVVRDEPERRTRLALLSARARSALREAGWALGDMPLPTPILPLRVGSAEAALALADRLERRGVLAVAIRPPTVPPGTARVRLALRCDLTDDELGAVLDAVGPPPAA